MRNNTTIIIKGVHQRIVNAIKKDQLWKVRALNFWRLILATASVGIVLGCIDPANCKPTAPDEPFQGSQLVIHPVAQQQFTATAVIASSCTLCGKEPQ